MENNNTVQNVVHGFKVFRPDWTCSPNGNTKQYACPGKFEEEGELDVCSHGMHFCQTAADCFNYYSFNSEWLDSDARYLLNQIPKDVVEWVYEENMTDEEKAAHPTYETTGGYLKVLDESECGQLWWGSLSDRRKEIIKAIPNFDAEIFFQCTGVRVDE